MRLTDNLRTQLANWAISRGSRRLAGATNASALGQRVTTPSDDPAGYASAMRQGDQSAALQAGARAARVSADGLSVADNTLDSIGELLTQAREIAVRAQNDTISSGDRAALGQQITSIREQVLALANTRGPQGYVFGGTATGTAPFSAAGTFVGNDLPVYSPLGASGPTIRANASGASAFTAAGGGRDVFADMQALATAMTANDLPGIRTAIDGLDGGMRQVTTEQQRVGLAVDRLRRYAELSDTAVVGIESSRARALGADDLPKIFTELTAAQSAYQRSLEATRRLLSLTSFADQGS
jgi:flagellar hook-associated protein 3 FlgL